MKAEGLRMKLILARSTFILLLADREGRLPIRLNNLLNEVFRRWQSPEELPDFPLLQV
jgi:hypothetical protein